jgi:hypothetical protein
MRGQKSCAPAAAPELTSPAVRRTSKTAAKFSEDESELSPRKTPARVSWLGAPATPRARARAPRGAITGIPARSRSARRTARRAARAHRRLPARRPPVQKAAAAPVEAVTVSPKRRGRPPKSSKEPEAEPATTPRRRGRPRKSA